MSLYVYCLGDELSEASVEGLAGVDGVSVRLLSLGRMAALVSETEDEPVTVTDENVKAHNRVNAAALAGSTPLPFRFGTRADRERLTEYAAANEAALLAALGRVRGCVEMSVKVKWDEKKAEGNRQQATVESERATVENEEERHKPDERREPDGAGVSTARAGRGTAFLMAKRREILGEDDVSRRAVEVAWWVAEAIVVRAAHLVERARVEEYRAHVRELSGERAGLRFLKSGPWPPYSFSDVGR
jgi:hypothetical protein